MSNSVFWKEGTLVDGRKVVEKSEPLDRNSGVRSPQRAYHVFESVAFVIQNSPESISFIESLVEVGLESVFGGTLLFEQTLHLAISFRIAGRHHPVEGLQLVLQAIVGTAQ